MVCIYCGSPTKVVNSRLQRRDNHIWRRRKCLSCASIFTTNESPGLQNAVMVRNLSGELKPFSRDALFITIYESCRHRPAAIDDATMLTKIIIGDLLSEIRSGIVHRNTIVRMTQTVLKRFDQAAATSYDAYHPARAITS